MSDLTPWVQKARYSDLFFRLLDPAFLVDPKTQQVLDANDSAEHALGIAKEELLNSPLSDWVRSDELESFAKQLRIAMRRYHARDAEFHLSTERKGNDFRLYRCALCQLQTPDGEIIVQIVASDITEERHAQEQNQKYTEELKLLNARLEALSTTDELTQISNFRYFKERLADEHQRAARYHRSYSILFFDIDHFKQYNDRNGHPAGDEALREFAKLLKNQSRETDLVARYGGEEFVVLASETPHSGCMTFAERVRTAVASHPFAHAAHQPLGLVSVSVGVASFPDHGATPEAVLKAADEAVYASKKAGRNRVTSAP
ncbi:MAG: diguanylate cyclase [Oligoflexia bacterium]